jgi:lysophospholipase L1-like esterase
VQSADGAPVQVTFQAPTVTGGLQPVSQTCTAQPGQFPVGQNPVNCTATDARGQSATCSFVVAVRPPPRLRFTQFLAFGDSLTQGEVSLAPTLLFLSPNDAYPAVLQRRLTTTYRQQNPAVLNDGLGGESAQGGGVTRLSQRLASVRPQVLLLMEGTNDLLAPPPAAADGAIASLRAMVRDAKARGVQVVLATIPPQRGTGSRAGVAALIPGFNDRIRALATAEQVVLADVYAAMQGDLTLIGVDDLHPTIRGYDVMAGVFLDAIRRSFEEAPPFAAGQRR